MRLTQRLDTQCKHMTGVKIWVILFFVTHVFLCLSASPVPSIFVDITLCVQMLYRHYSSLLLTKIKCSIKNQGYYMAHEKAYKFY